MGNVANVGSGGGGALTFTPLKTADYTAGSGERVLMSGGHAVNLPAATIGNIVGAENTDGNGAMTVVAPAGTISGRGVAAAATSIPLGAAGFVVLQADGTNWHIVGGYQDSGWVTPTTFTASWGQGTLVSFRLIANRVYLRGMLANTGGGVGSVAFTLPVGFRPPGVYNPIWAAPVGVAPGESLFQINGAGSASPGALAVFMAVNTFPDLSVINFAVD